LTVLREERRHFFTLTLLLVFIIFSEENVFANLLARCFEGLECFK
jgi:hypothetical protein